MGEIIFLLIVAGVGGLYLSQTFGYTIPMLDNSGGPALFPKIVCVGLIILVIFRIIQIVSQKDYKHFRFMELFKGSTGFFFLSVVALIVLMPHLGFIVTCFLFETITGNVLMYLKKKTLGCPWQIIVREVFFLAFVIGLYFFFTKILFVALPTGILSGLNF